MLDPASALLLGPAHTWACLFFTLPLPHSVCPPPDYVSHLPPGVPVLALQDQTYLWAQVMEQQGQRMSAHWPLAPKKDANALYGMFATIGGWHKKHVPAWSTVRVVL